MKLTSPAFDDGGAMPPWCGKKTENISPPLEWTNVPAGTRSFALAVVDTHPVARGYVHWMISGLPGEARGLRRGASAALPPGTREHRGYAGPFPPSGTHNYEFRLYALTTDQLEVPADADLDGFTRAAQGNAGATAVLVGAFTKI
ncbi:YbhB/YbcL family Raf kinase inhibitor-like protein [Specibacter sp. RAF43]|uniref:YbhB/YbcL family Raf kinase inhibitor-like protein n=1 Tax=Specibacter sp. RAF43 TaxID=3233057 RepID=UPI003F96286B